MTIRQQQLGCLAARVVISDNGQIRTYPVRDSKDSANLVEL